jgi:hypothetical protein
MVKCHFKIHGEKKGFGAECLELDSCITQADSWVSSLLFGFSGADGSF